MTNTTVSGTKTIYSVTTKLLTNRGDRSNPDSTMHTRNHSPSGCTRGAKGPPFQSTYDRAGTSFLKS